MDGNFGPGKIRRIVTHPDVAVRCNVDLNGDVVVLAVVFGQRLLLRRKSNDVLLGILCWSRGGGHSTAGGGVLLGWWQRPDGEFGRITDSQLPRPLRRSIEYFLQ